MATTAGLYVLALAIYLAGVHPVAADIGNRFRWISARNAFAAALAKARNGEERERLGQLEACIDEAQRREAGQGRAADPDRVTDQCLDNILGAAAVTQGADNAQRVAKLFADLGYTPKGST